MCRKNHLCGCALMAFGLGIGIGAWLESGFFCFFLTICMIGLGFWCAKRK